MCYSIFSVRNGSLRLRSEMSFSCEKKYQMLKFIARKIKKRNSLRGCDYTKFLVYLSESSSENVKCTILYSTNFALCKSCLIFSLVIF